MYKRLYLLLVFIAIAFSSPAQKKINADSLRLWDSLFHEAAKTEVYEPVPPIITPGTTPQDAPSDALIMFNGKNLNAWYGDDSTKAPGWDVVNGILIVNEFLSRHEASPFFVDSQNTIHNIPAWGLRAVIAIPSIQIFSVEHN